MERQELIEAVKTRIDEMNLLEVAAGAPVGCPDDSPVEVLADRLLDECCQEVLIKAPAWRLTGESFEGRAIEESDGTGYVDVPNDFVRLLEFKMSGWRRPVTVVYEMGCNMALKQYNRFMRGGVCKPVCVLSHRKSGRVIEYYSVASEHVVERFIYVPVCVAEELPRSLQDVLVWFCASRVLAVSGRAAESQAAYEKGVNLL